MPSPADLALFNFDVDKYSLEKDELSKEIIQLKDKLSSLENQINYCNMMKYQWPHSTPSRVATIDLNESSMPKQNLNVSIIALLGANQYTSWLNVYVTITSCEMS